MSPEEIQDKYADRVVAILSAISLEIQAEDPTLVLGEVYDLGCDDYRWSFNVCGADQADAAEHEPQGVDVTFVICESERYEGEEKGVNFAVEIVGVQGEIVGGITPYNYTDQCWVSRDDADAVEERFRVVEQAPAYEAAHLVIEFLKGE